MKVNLGMVEKITNPGHKM